MSSRHQQVPRDVICTLIRQGAVIPCYRCEVPFTEYDCSKPAWIEREDIQEVGLGGKQTVENSAYSHGQRHPDTPCHGVVTNGTKATTAGSSKHKNAKVKRLQKEARGEPKRKRRKAKWAKGRKIKSRNNLRKPKK